MLVSNGKTVKQYFNLHMTLEEWKIIMKFVKKKCSLKWFVYLMLLSFRGLRPAEALAINVMDFITATGKRNDYSLLTFREAKTNKMRVKEYIVPELQKLLRTYIEMNNFFEKSEGYIFPFYKKKVNGRPYMCTMSATLWFIQEVRNPLKEKYESFRDWYPVYTKKGDLQKRYRINTYSFRRFFETYIYLNNEFAPRSSALLREIMDYGSGFDPLKHYVKVIHSDEYKRLIIEKTFSNLAVEITKGQKTLSDF